MPAIALLLLLVVGLLDLAAAPTPAGRIPKDVFVLRPLDWIPSVPQVRVVPVAFPDTKPMGYIHALASTGERLWMSAHPFNDTNLPPTAGRLWTFLPGDNRIDPATGILEVHAVHGLQAQGKRLWLRIDGGLARMDAASFAVDPFGSAQGIPGPQPPAVAETSRGFFALGDSGALFRLSPDEKAFIRFDANPPTPDTRDTSAWGFLSGSGEWLMAATDRRVAIRHAEAQRWSTLPTALRPRSPELDPIRIFAVCPDAEGGFWIGCDAGLGFIHAANGTARLRERVGLVTVPGGLGIAIAPGMQPTAAAIEAARERVADGIRERMKLRARLARAARESGQPVDAVTPLSRIPGGVRALAMDRGFLWVATADPAFPMRSRILLFHPGSQKWVGGFPFAFPVTALTADDRYLWVGADTQFARATPLYAVEKSALLSIPASRWSPDTLDADDIRMKLASLPATERTVFAFFSGDYASVLRWTEGDTLTDEQWFLRAMCYDPVGLNQPDAFSLNLRRLVIRHPDSVFTRLATALLERAGSGRPTEGSPSPASALPSASTPAPALPPSTGADAGTTVPMPPSPSSTATAAPTSGVPAAVAAPSIPAPARPVSPQQPSSPSSQGTPALTLPKPTSPPAAPSLPASGLPGSAPEKASAGATDTAAAMLKRRDLNRDGKLNLVELRLWLGPTAELRDWDRNGDRELDREEFQAFYETQPAR